MTARERVTAFIAHWYDDGSDIIHSAHVSASQGHPLRMSDLREVMELAGPLTGDQFTAGASAEEEYCGCGEPITWYGGEWLHIINPVLRGTDDHDAHPSQGYYEPPERCTCDAGGSAGCPVHDD